MIPNPAALQIFTEVWAEYAALTEAEQRDPTVLNFIMDVEYAVRTLYPQMSSYRAAMAQLSKDSKSVLPASRCALGSAFINNSLWPVRSYFNSK